MGLKLPLRAWVFFALAIFLAMPAGLGTVLATEFLTPESPNLVLENEFISIVVNTTNDGTGRFAINTTGGDPNRDDDNNKALIYGQPRPWTSFTTIRISGRDYVFGGESVRRAGRTGRYGLMIAPPQLVDNNRASYSAWQYQDIMVSQQLEIVRSTTTRFPDTAQITYTVVNTGDEVRSVGMRVVMDTQLGANDGAPFRAGDREITSDTVLSRNEIPNFYQAFDNLQNPAVTAQGTLTGPAVTPPDRVFFTNWGSLADGIWDFDFLIGRDFTRKDEFELDSAVALYWDPKPLAPGETRRYITHYGLGGISIATGELSLGVTSPSEVTHTQARPGVFDIIAYLENTGDGEALGTQAVLHLPRGLELVPGQTLRRDLGNLLPEETRQVVWKVQPSGALLGDLEYGVEVWAEELDPTSVRRQVRVVMPADLRLELLPTQPVRLDGRVVSPRTLTIRGSIENIGGATAHNVSVLIASPVGMKLSEGENRQRLIGPLLPGEKVQVSWTVDLTGVGRADLPYSMLVESTSLTGPPLVKNGSIPVPTLSGSLRLESRKIMDGKILEVIVWGHLLDRPLTINFDLRYPADLLQLRQVSRGTAFVLGEAGRSPARLAPGWRPGQIGNGLIRGMGGEFAEPRYIWEEELARVYFLILKPGSGEIRLENPVYEDEERSVRLAPETLTVQL